MSFFMRQAPEFVIVMIPRDIQARCTFTTAISTFAMKRRAPLVNVEIRGVPALKFLGDIIWK
uniref:Uncharacterized protein n=1 Tax=Manihot esculenta TaxID=3983 RepID=A0A2C9VJW8_MANES